MCTCWANSAKSTSLREGTTPHVPWPQGVTSTALAPCSSKRMPGIPDHVHSSRITACTCMAHAV
eukprot:scaffold2869_cov69-Phaeocystis_antarctica.AAC.2